MSRLRIFDDDAPGRTAMFDSRRSPTHRARTGAIGVSFEHWEASQPVAPGASPKQVMAAYRADIDRLVAEHGFKHASTWSASRPTIPTARQCAPSSSTSTSTRKTRCASSSPAPACSPCTSTARSTRSECEAGDLIARARRHHRTGSTWAPEPSFVAIRFFTEPDGWVGHFTGTDIAQQFPRYRTDLTQLTARLQRPRHSREAGIALKARQRFPPTRNDEQSAKPCESPIPIQQRLHAHSRAILTDIEGTTSSISFVKDVLFPYARRALPGFVARTAAMSPRCGAGWTWSPSSTAACARTR